MHYQVLDSENNLIRTFPTYKQAETYRFAYGNNGWSIKIVQK